MRKAALAYPTVSVVIPCYNSAASLELLLRSLAVQTSAPEEIICVDDSSRRREHDEMACLAPSFGAHLLRLPEPRVPMGRRSMARNLGSKCARGEVLVYVDGDMILSPRYIEATRFIHALDRRAIVKGTRYSIRVDEQRRGADHCLAIVCEGRAASRLPKDLYVTSRDGVSGSMFLRWGVTDSGALTRNRLPYSNRWDFCASNNLSVRRREVARIGYWDENFLGWGEEDMDLAYRLFTSGCRPVLPDRGPLYAYHLDHQIGGESNMLSLQRNARYLIGKYPVMVTYRGEAYRRYGLEEWLLGQSEMGAGRWKDYSGLRYPANR